MAYQPSVDFSINQFKQGGAVMGKRARDKRLRKQPSHVRASIFDRLQQTWLWRQFKHPHFWIAVIAFVLVLGYPLVTGSVWYKKEVAHVSAEQIAVDTATQAVITTPKGQIVFDFYKNDAPKTSENFIRLATRKYYDNLTFHRVMSGFMIQGGDPNGDGSGGKSAWGGSFADEINASSALYTKGYVAGTVAMANKGPNTNSNGSQFFIVLADQQSLPANYTIFGHVTSGMDVVQKIAVGDKMTTVAVQ